MSYLDKTREERRRHLRLETPCNERGGYSTLFRGLLADKLGTEIFIDKKIVLCHACHNEKCSNPEHMYWGSYNDNIEDQKENGTWKSVWDRTVDKYGYEEAVRMNGIGNKSAGGRANKGIPKSEEHRRKISEGLKKRKERVA